MGLNSLRYVTTEKKAIVFKGNLQGRHGFWLLFPDEGGSSGSFRYAADMAHVVCILDNGNGTTDETT